jgi:hypothetical protein
MLKIGVFQSKIDNPHFCILCLKKENRNRGSRYMLKIGVFQSKIDNPIICILCLKKKTETWFSTYTEFIIRNYQTAFTARCMLSLAASSGAAA